LTLALTNDAAQVEEALCRAVFNIVFRNQDDHTKNFGFMMDESGRWRLAPAFDLTYTYGTGMAATHQMRLAGKDDAFVSADLIAAGREVGMSASRVKAMIEQVQDVASTFFATAVLHGLDEEFCRGLERRFRRLA
jgi:serine/threonine-protein kinase HipA